LCRGINDERVLHYTPLKSCRIIVAIAVLHNLCILAQVPHYRDNEELVRNDNFNDWLEGQHDEDGDVEGGDDYDPILMDGLNVRNQVVNYLEQLRG